MRLSELMGKEVINIGNGARLGVINECDLGFDDKSGKIQALILPSRGLLSFLGDTHSEIIPWLAIKRIGDDVIIVDLTNVYDKMYPRIQTKETEY